MTNKITYTTAFAELKLLVEQIEDGQISIDDLSAKVKRATVLINICRDKLKETEEDVNKILKDLENN